MLLYMVATLSVLCIANGALTGLNNNGDYSHKVTSLLYTNSWAVEIHGGLDIANDIAQRHGLINMGQVSVL